MKLLFVHPGPLLHTNVFLRLESLGLELAEKAARRVGHSHQAVACDLNSRVERDADRATCYVPPLFTEPGNHLHAPAEIGVDLFQAHRSPTDMYRTAPLAGLWTHQKGGFLP